MPFADAARTLVEGGAHGSGGSPIGQMCGGAIGPHPCLYSSRRRLFSLIVRDCAIASILPSVGCPPLSPGRQMMIDIELTAI
jgi:hypothetical protein